MVSVLVNPVKIGKKPPTVKYKVSGGKIIGKGTKVSWDLNGVGPGIYTLSAQIKGDKIFHSKSVSVIECEKCNEDEGVESVNLDKTKVTLACPWTSIRSKIEPCPSEERKIRILTFSPNAEKTNLTYYYFPSGGKIIGEGANVVWDFTGARPGTYSITIGVGKDGVLKGNSIIKNITVEPCECLMPCSCPSLTVLGPSGQAQPEDTVIFTANLSGGTQDRATYNWTVSAGTIIGGQGTSQILVKTTKEMKGQIVTATVQIGGLCSDCPQTTASASVDIAKK